MRKTAAFLIAATLSTGAANAQGWTALTPPLRPDTVIDTNPLQGLYWHDGEIVPTVRPSTEHYFRVAWADLEPRENVYDFTVIEQKLRALRPGERIAFGVMPLNTCCSTRGGLDVPDYVRAGQTKGFWIAADPSAAPRTVRVYVPDWNDPFYIARWRALWQAIGKRFDGDPRVTWIDVRAYGNWGEGHLAGSAVYPGSNIPYADASLNRAHAAPGTLSTRFALADAIVDALPHTRLLAMTDDTPVLVHLLRRSTAIPIGMKRDSWGARHFEVDFIPRDLPEQDKALIRERWKTAPLIVESFGWERAFEAGYDGIVDQVSNFHVSAIGNGGFAASRWNDFKPLEQSALIRSGNRAGYRFVPYAARYRQAACGTRVEIRWRNDGVAPAYEPWLIELRLGAGQRPSSTPMPNLLPGETARTETCLLRANGRGSDLLLEVVDARGSGRTMLLPLQGATNGVYRLGSISLSGPKPHSAR